MLRVEPDFPELVQIIDGEKQVTQLALAMFTSWFECATGVKDGLMDEQACCAFISRVMFDSLIEIGHVKEVVQPIFGYFDDDIDGNLTLDNFLAFFANECMAERLPRWVIRNAEAINEGSNDEVQLSSATAESTDSRGMYRTWYTLQDQPFPYPYT